VRDLLTHLRPLWGAGAVHRSRHLWAMPPSGGSRDGASDVAALWETRNPARRDRLVRALLAAGTATKPGCGLRRLRPDHPVDRCTAVSPLLGPFPAPPARSRHQPRCDA
jgi:hypothetical protein